MCYFLNNYKKNRGIVKNCHYEFLKINLLKYEMSIIFESFFVINNSSLKKAKSSFFILLLYKN
jgi:hypothetical protein